MTAKSVKAANGPLGLGSSWIPSWLTKIPGTGTSNKHFTRLYVEIFTSVPLIVALLTVGMGRSQDEYKQLTLDGTPIQAGVLSSPQLQDDNLHYHI